jgi:hypothetical protein
MTLSEDQISTFLNDGVLVVENVLSSLELNDCINGLNETLAQHHVDVNDLESSGRFLRSLSSTNGSGGVLDIAYYDDWKIRNISTNPSLLAITQQLWKAAYLPIQPNENQCTAEKYWKFHPYGNFDCDKGYLYIDRIGYRLPTELAEKLGASDSMEAGDNKSRAKKRKSVAIQRSLTPHLDCCPETFFSTHGKKKWRPMLHFISGYNRTKPRRI